MLCGHHCQEQVSAAALFLSREVRAFALRMLTCFADRMRLYDQCRPVGAADEVEGSADDAAPWPTGLVARRQEKLRRSSDDGTSASVPWLRP
jgi:hypothetical protein